MTTGLTLINWLGRGSDIADLVLKLEDENKRLKVELDEANRNLEQALSPDLRGNTPVS